MNNRKFDIRHILILLIIKYNSTLQIMPCAVYCTVEMFSNWFKVLRIIPNYGIIVHFISLLRSIKVQKYRNIHSEISQSIIQRTQHTMRLNTHMQPPRALKTTAVYRVRHWQQKTKRWREHRQTRFNRQSRRCLIRYLEVAKCLLIYRCYARRDVDRDSRHAFSTRDARLMGHVLTRNKSRLDLYILRPSRSIYAARSSRTEFCAQSFIFRMAELALQAV